MATNNIFVKNLTKFFQTIWAIWAVFILFFSGIFAVIAYFLIFNLASPQNTYKYTWHVTRFWGNTILFFTLLRIKNIGKELLDKEQNYVLVSNHVSAMDIPFCMAVCPVPFSFLAKSEVDKLPMVGYLARNMHVYVNRKNEESRKHSFENMKQHMHKNRSIHIYVEGTRNTTTEPLNKFHDGAFKLAIELKKPIAVLTLVNVRNVVPFGAMQLRPGTVAAIWHEPIATTNMTEEDIPYLKEKVRQMMLADLVEYKEEMATFI